MSGATTRRQSKVAKQAAEVEATKTTKEATSPTTTTEPPKVTQEEDKDDDSGSMPFPPNKALSRADYIGSDGMVRIAQPTTQDILFIPQDDDSSRRSQVDWPGNMFFQGLVLSRKSTFIDSTKRSEQTRIATEIVQAVRYANGRFLQKDGKDWCEMTEGAILNELGKLLRNDYQTQPLEFSIPQNENEYKYNQFQSMYLTPVYGKQALLDQDNNEPPLKRQKAEDKALSHWADKPNRKVNKPRKKRLPASLDDLPRGVTMRPSGKWVSDC